MKIYTRQELLEFISQNSETEYIIVYGPDHVIYDVTRFMNRVKHEEETRIGPNFFNYPDPTDFEAVLSFLDSELVSSLYIRMGLLNYYTENFSAMIPEIADVDNWDPTCDCERPLVTKLGNLLDSDSHLMYWYHVMK